MSTLRSLLVVALAFSLGTLALLDPVSAQSRDRRVSFQLIVDLEEDQEESVEHRRRLHQEVAREAASRIEIRLDALGVKNHRVRLNNANAIDVMVYGSHSAEAIRSAVIPPGRLDVRHVNLDQSFWFDLADDLPDSVEIRQHPGSVESDEIFLYSRNSQDLITLIDRITMAGVDLRIYPHGAGWRTVQLGEVPLATEQGLRASELGRTPSAIPFVTTRFTPDAAQELRSASTELGTRHIALVLDGELIGIQPFSHRQFSDTIILDCPDFLRSHDARRRWAIQVAGRLAAPLPVTLVEAQEL